MSRTALGSESPRKPVESRACNNNIGCLAFALGIKEEKIPGQQEPERINPQTIRNYLEVMSKAVFKAGISWRVVESKWPGTREAFGNFDVNAVADLSPRDIDGLVQDTRVIRNRRKLEAVVSNANRMLELEGKPGSFRNCLLSHGSFVATVADLRKVFKFLGDIGTYFFLFAVGEEVPSHEEWVASRQR